jgi:hypothetical protein
MGMGQAAGAAAGLAVKGAVAPREIKTVYLQDSLEAQGAILEAPESDIEVGNPKW